MADFDAKTQADLVSQFRSFARDAEAQAAKSKNKIVREFYVGSAKTWEDAAAVLAGTKIATSENKL